MRALCPAKTLVLIIAVVFPSAASPQAAVQGLGTKSCAEFAQDYRVDPIFNGARYYAWAQGYMGGINTALIASAAQSTDLSGVSIEEQKRHIIRFCERSPLAQFIEAVLDLFDTMRAQQSLPKWHPS